MKPSIILGPIVGGLSNSSVNIWIRANATSQMFVWLSSKSDHSNARFAGSTLLEEKDGFCGIVHLDNLLPETSYGYAVTLRKTHPNRKSFQTFKTFPNPGVQKSFDFVFGSCYLPPDSAGGQTMAELHKFVKSKGIRFGIFLGDQIYADAINKNGLGHVAVSLEDYRSVYLHTWSNPVMKKLLPSLPLFMILDDHEVDDDWRWRDISRDLADYSVLKKIHRWLKKTPIQERHLTSIRVQAALKAYHEHQAIHAPDLLLPFPTNTEGEFIFKPHDPASMAYTFYHGDAAFFVLDTRTMRVGGRNRTILGTGQWHVLMRWLLEVNKLYSVKFIVSSCSLLHPFWLDIVSDRWAGFPIERRRLLEFLAINEIEGVHILTGDLHSGHAVTAKLKSPRGKRIPISEYCSSPFEQRSIWLSIGYIPLFSKWLTQIRRHFYRAYPNFGHIHVDYSGPKPAVTFTMHYRAGEWKDKSITL